MNFNFFAFGEFDRLNFFVILLNFLFTVAALFMMLAGAQAQCGGPICATDLRSGGPQNFNSVCDMNAENNRGGSKFD